MVHDILKARWGVPVPDMPPDPPQNHPDADASWNDHSGAKADDSAHSSEHQAHAVYELREEIQKIFRHAKSRGLYGKTQKIPNDAMLFQSRSALEQAWSRVLAEPGKLHLLALLMIVVASASSILVNSLSAATGIYRKHVRPSAHWSIPFVTKADQKKILSILMMPFDEDAAPILHQVYSAMREASQRDGETRLQVFETGQLPRLGPNGDYEKENIVEFGIASGAHVVVVVKRYGNDVLLVPMSRLVPNARPHTVKLDGAASHLPGPGDEEWAKVWYAIATSVATTSESPWAVHARPVPMPLPDLADRLNLLRIYTDLLSVNFLDLDRAGCVLRWSLAVETARVSLDPSAGRWIAEAVAAFVEFVNSGECTSLKEFALYDLAAAKEWFKAYARDICRVQGGAAADVCVDRVSEHLARIKTERQSANSDAGGAPGQRPNVVPLPPRKPFPSARGPRHGSGLKSTKTSRSRHLGRPNAFHRRARGRCGPRELLTAHRNCTPRGTHTPLRLRRIG